MANSASSFGSKVGCGLGSALLGWIIAAVNLVYIFVPLVLIAVSLIFIYLYKLDKEYDNIIKDLDERKLKQQ